jgi:hypothetical protein
MNSFALHPVNVDDWNLMDFHTVLHFLTSHTDDQTALLQMFTVTTPTEDAAAIWDSWAAAFSGPTDPPLPIGFNQSALTPCNSSSPIQKHLGLS